jgi:hypothetical protein
MKSHCNAPSEETTKEISKILSEQIKTMFELHEEGSGCNATSYRAYELMKETTDAEIDETLEEYFPDIKSPSLFQLMLAFHSFIQYQVFKESWDKNIDFVLSLNIYILFKTSEALDGLKDVGKLNRLANASNEIKTRLFTRKPVTDSNDDAQSRPFVTKDNEGVKINRYAFEGLNIFCQDFEGRRLSTEFKERINTELEELLHSSKETSPLN